MNVLRTTFDDRTFRYWFPAAAAGAIALILFVLVGHTPFIRALGLAGVITGTALTLRRFGSILAVTGGLALAFSPAFWSQTGGVETASLGFIAVLLVVVVIATALVSWFGKATMWALMLGAAMFTLLFWLLVGTPRSLRLTAFFSAWLFYLLIDGLLTTNPRPDGPPPAPLKTHHTVGIILLFALGVINEPLFTLLSPAVILCLALAKHPFPRWYWAIVLLITLLGVRGMVVQYIDTGWWLFPAAQAEDMGLRVPYVMADGWHEASRWLYLFNLVIRQFTPFGVLLGILGLARLARWYPVLGEVTMVAYAAYAIFGLVYFGRDSTVVLLPLLIIQIIWMTYAVYTFSQWLQKSLKMNPAVGWFAPAIFTLLPLLLLFRIIGVV